MFEKQTLSGKIAICLIAAVVVFGFVIALFVAASEALKRRVPIYETLGPSLLLYIVAIIGSVVYLAPSLIAALRRHPSNGFVAVLNVCFGWTAIGWLAALTWSFVSWRLPINLSIGVGRWTLDFSPESPPQTPAQGPEQAPAPEQKPKRGRSVVLRIVGVLVVGGAGFVYATWPDPYYSPAHARDMMQLTLKFSAACDGKSDHFTRELEGWKPFFIRAYGGDLQAMEKDLKKAIDHVVLEAQRQVPTCAEVQEAYRISVAVRERHYASERKLR